MAGFKSIFSGTCAVTVLAGCQSPMVFTPESIKPYPLQQSSTAPVAAQPVAIQSTVIAEPSYVLESAPIVQAEPVPAYVIQNEIAGDAMAQPVSEAVIVSEPAYVLEAQPAAASVAIAEPVVVEEIEILSAPVLDSSVAPVIQETMVESSAAPMVETIVQPMIDTMAADAMPEGFSTFSESGAMGVEVMQPTVETIAADAISEGLSTFSESGAMGVEVMKPSVNVGAVTPAPTVPIMIEAQPLAPLGGAVQPGIAAYGQSL